MKGTWSLFKIFLEGLPDSRPPTPGTFHLAMPHTDTLMTNTDSVEDDTRNQNEGEENNR